MVLASVGRMQRQGVREGRLRTGMTVRVIEVKIERSEIARDTAQIRN